MPGPVRKTVVNLRRPPEPERVNVRPWRDPAELEGRDLRPGHFSVTGEFIRLSDQAEDSHLNREEPRHVGQ